MKKKDRIFWAVYIVAGMVMMAVGLKLDIEYYSTLLFAIGFSFMTNGLVRVVGNWYHMRPENREEYQEKLRRQQINLKDERKMQLRIENAKLLLKNTDLSIEKIAERCSFYDSGTFIKKFTACTGMSPKKYRIKFLAEHDNNK